MNKFINIGVILLTICVLVGDAFYITTSSLLIKSLTSLGFVLIGLLSLIYAVKSKTEKNKFCVIMFIGLVFAMFGDIVLEIEFIIGAMLFAVGHVFYFMAYCFLSKFKLRDFIIGAAIFVPSTLIILFVPIFNFDQIIMQVVCVVYAIVISCMLGKAISNYSKERSLLTLLLMIGSSLFFFSDLMLLFNVFSNVSKVFGYLCLISYYPAECILAYSIMKTKNLAA